jgi:polyketide-type polyunsaturated fatty acid synthase PfaA
MPNSLKFGNALIQLSNEVDRLEKTIEKLVQAKKMTANNNKSMSKNQLKTQQINDVELQQTPIAIVGMASILPRSRNLQEYWSKIVEKVDCITDVPASRWNIEDYYDPDPRSPDKTYCKRGGFIPDFDFNPMEFGLPPNQLEVTDISQLLGLMVAKEALADSGYDQKAFDRERTGVILGVALARQLTMPLAARLQYPIWSKALKSSGLSDEDTQKIIDKIKKAYIDWEPNAFPGMLANIVAGRIANRFDLGGMNCIVDAACASSFGALSMAISELTSRRADMMLTGGVDTDNSIVAYMCFSKTPAISPSQNSKPFDQDSDGMMLGEGVGMLVLKRLEDAERDQDKIYAVIKGIGTSSDGRHKSIYAPRPEGQMRALRRAYQEAGFPPTSVSCIEAHGTGTMAGDPAEFAALKAVFAENEPEDKQSVALGSVKSQIGHTKAAAGAASLIKTALSLHHKILPPTLNVTKPNPKLEIENSPFYLNTETRPWLRKGDIPRRAGVSSFGFGGTNYHVVLEEYNSEASGAYRLHHTPQALLLSESSYEQLLQKCQAIVEKLKSPEAEQHYSELVNASKNQEIPITLARLGFVAASIDEAINKLQKGIDCLKRQPQALEWKHPQGIFYRQTGLEMEGKVVALFSGQGSQYLNMGRELAMNFPCLRETYHDIDRLFIQAGLEPISEQVFPAPTFEQTEQDKQAQVLQQTEISQPAIAGLSVGLYKILQQAGFKPDFLVGHSFGELTALWAAQVLSDQDYFFLVKERGQAMAAKPNSEAGAMLAVQGDVNKIEAEIANFKQIRIANYNSPQQLVLAGIKSEINLVQGILQNKGYSTVLLPVSAAFHTPLVAHAQEPFARAIEAVTFNKPQIPVFANVTSNPYPFESQEIQKILKKHLFNQVQFKEQIENIYAGGGFCFVEFGPRRILTNFVTEILSDRPHIAVALNSSRQQDSDRQLREAVVELRVAGLPLKNLDPYQALPKIPQTPKKPALNVRLNSVNYQSEKTKMTFEQALLNGQSKSPSEIAVAKKDTDNYVSSVNGHNSEQNAIAEGVAKPFAITNQHEHSVQKTPEVETDYPTIPTQKETNYQRVLESLEYSLSQFNHHQKETLEAHKLYLDHQTQYTKTFFQLMQQQGSLLANMSNMPEAAQKNQTEIIKSTERSLTKFQEHQADTLRIHEQYLKHQGEYAKNLLQLTQGSYGQLLRRQEAEGRGLKEESLVKITETSSSSRQEPLLTTSEPELQIVSVPIEVNNNQNGHTNGYEPNVKAIAVEKQVQQTQPEHQPDSSSLTVATTSSLTINVETLSQTLLDVVSDKTGYPAEMLELEMDLEADLGIDSIKRVEILGALQEEMPELPQPNLEELAELHTLAQIISYLESRAADFDQKSSFILDSQSTMNVEQAANDNYVQTQTEEAQKKTPPVGLTVNQI